MRKLTVELIPSPALRKLQKPIFKHIESFELLEMLKFDFEMGTRIGLMKVKVKEGYSIKEVELPYGSQILSVLKEESDKHICVVKIQVPEDFKKTLKEFDLNLIWTTPLIITQDKRVYSCIGENESIKTFLESIKNYGEVVNISFQTAAYREHDILSVLTEKQREIIIAANKYGYYDYPKKINSQQLSQKVKLSKPTLIQHLRKAEGRIMANIFTGY